MEGSEKYLLILSRVILVTSEAAVQKIRLQLKDKLRTHKKKKELKMFKSGQPGGAGWGW